MEPGFIRGHVEGIACKFEWSWCLVVGSYLIERQLYFFQCAPTVL